jgi:serine/threonine protein kinase
MVTVSATASDGGGAPRLGRYQLGERIGSGGVAEVVRATLVGAGEFRRAVVVKQIRPELREHAEVRAAFVREAELAQHLHHPDVVAVLDLGTDDGGAPYLVLELVDGCTLQRVLDDAADHGRALPIAAVLHVVGRIAAALAYVHGARDASGAPLGLVHRDVTPANVLLGRDGAVKLTDFGIARAAALGSDTLPGFIKGTVRYLAPEQAAGRPVDARADVFALGLVLRRALIGDGPLDPLDPELRAIIEAATEPAVRDRLPSAEALADRLGRYRESAGIPEGSAELVALVGALQPPVRRVRSLDAALARAPAAPTRQLAPPEPTPTAAPRRRRGPWLGASLVGVLGVAALAWFMLRRPESASVDTTPVTETLATAPAPIPVPAVDPPPVARDPVSTPTASRTSSAPAPAPARPKERAPARGRLLINPVPYAEVTIDGKSEGTTPFDRALSAGEHTVELYNPDTERRKSVRVTIAPGEPSSITHW